MLKDMPRHQQLKYAISKDVLRGDSTVFYILEPKYDQLQHDNSVKLMESTIETCLKKASDLKMRTVSFSIAPAQCKAWSSGLYERTKIRSIISTMKRLDTVELVRLVSEDHIVTNNVKEILDEF